MSKYLFQHTAANRRPRSTYHSAPRKSKSTKEYIHPSRFIKPAKQVADVIYSAKNKFDDFEIAQLLKSNLMLRDWDMPTPIQDQTIPLALNGSDVVGIANTGPVKR